MKDRIRSAQIVLPCREINPALEFFVGRLGFRLEMIFPADEPATAVVSGYGVTLRLERSTETQPFTLRLLCDPSPDSDNIPREIFSPDEVRVIFSVADSVAVIPEGRQEFVLTRFEEANSWSEGRAGMQYRDLIPGRLGGRFVASHIRIPEGGEIPDYVHYHRIRFQMIYCLSGWARLVYEDQGEPFLMQPGDCVLQPPEIRHRVLETSPQFEVLEIGCPAIHETFADHELPLPNDAFYPERIFGDQRFVHHVAEDEEWSEWLVAGLESRDTGISAATGGLADVRLLRAHRDTEFCVKHEGEFLFFFVLKGSLRLGDDKGASYRLGAGDCFVVPAGAEYHIETDKGTEMLRISL